MKKLIFITLISLIFLSCKEISRDVIVTDKIYIPSRIQVMGKNYTGKNPDSLSPAEYIITFDIKTKGRFTTIEKIKLPVSKNQFETIKIGDTLRYLDDW